MSSSSDATTTTTTTTTLRHENSLGTLTRSFVDMLKTAPSGDIDLNQASRDLGVQKRRIYDITNVLEGVGLIEKKSKNCIHWRGNGANSDSKDEAAAEKDEKREIEQKREELAQLQKEEDNIKDYCTQIQSKLRDLAEDFNQKKYAFVSHEDVRAIEEFHNQTLLAVKAPSGTKLEVPNPDDPANLQRNEQEKHYEIYLNSCSAGEIEVFLIAPPNDSTTAAAANAAHQTSVTTTTTTATAAGGGGGVATTTTTTTTSPTREREALDVQLRPPPPPPPTIMREEMVASKHDTFFGPMETDKSLLSPTKSDPTSPMKITLSPKLPQLRGSRGDAHLFGTSSSNVHDIFSENLSLKPFEPLYDFEMQDGETISDLFAGDSDGRR